MIEDIKARKSDFITIGITPPIILYGEERAEEISEILSLLRDNTVSFLHLRKPDATKEDIASILSRIPPEYLSRITLHNHFDLIYEYPVGGFHISRHISDELKDRLLMDTDADGMLDLSDARVPVRITYSAHSLREIQGPQKYHYAFLSPIFDSISKEGYKSSFDLSGLRQLLKDIPTPVIALGGVTPDKKDLLQNAGFSGMAMLGALFYH